MEEIFDFISYQCWNPRGCRHNSNNGLTYLKCKRENDGIKNVKKNTK